MSQKLVQSQSMQQVQTLSPQQVLQVRLLEMPVSELEQRVKNELIDNGALEESLGSPEDADTSSEDVYDGTDAESAGIETSGLDGGLPSDEYRPAEVRQAMDDYRTPDDVPDYLLQERGGKDRPETMDYGDILYPDFPTGGAIDVSKYNDGQRGGALKVRAKIEIGRASCRERV